MTKRCKPQMTKAEDGTSYIVPEPLPFTPGFKRLVSGTRCLVILPEYVRLGGITAYKMKCTIKECYEHVIQIGVGRGHHTTYLVSPLFLVIPLQSGRLPLGWLHRLYTESTNCIVGFPIQLATFIRKAGNQMGRGDKKVRKPKKKLKRRRTPAQRMRKAKEISSKRVKQPKKKRVTITGAIYAYFDSVIAKHGNLEKITYVSQSISQPSRY